MANETVETKVVQVRFDNSKFSKNIKTTIKQCDQLDKSLEFKGSQKGIKNISKAIKEVEVAELNKELENTNSIIGKVSIGVGELLKIKLLGRVIDIVTNKTESMIKSMLGINNVVAGWRQYEEQMTNVGGILNQVSSKGYGLVDVTEAMDRLRWYTDETSYSFTTLSNGIRQFVVAGIDLNKAAEAAMGVTNLAGSAKVFDEFKIQSGMNAVSKAMQAGYLDLQKWNTLTQTAGIVTEEFSQKLLDEAAAQGKLIKSAGGAYKTKKSGKTVTTDNIASTLSDRWATSDVVANVMNQYSSASTAVEMFTNYMAEQTDESLTAINEMFKESGVQFKSFDDIITKLPEDVSDSMEMTAEQTARALEGLGYQFDEVSLKAFKSSQETTSFGQSVEYVKKAISTQWSSIFEAIFGNYERATKLWTGVSNKFYDVFISPFESLSDVFSAWSEESTNGAEDFRNTIITVIDIIGKFKDAAAKGFKEIFNVSGVDVLKAITNALKNFFENLKNNETVFNFVSLVTKAIALYTKIIGKVLGTVFKIASKLLKIMQPILDILIEVLDAVVNGIDWLVDLVDSLGFIDKVCEAIANVLGKVADAVKKLIEQVSSRINLEKVANGIGKAINFVADGIDRLIGYITTLTDKVKDFIDRTGLAEGATKVINKFKNAIEGMIGSLKNSNITDDGSLSVVDKIKAALTKFIGTLKETFVSVNSFLTKSGIIKGFKNFFETIKDILLPIIETIKTFFKNVYETAKEDPVGAIKKIATAIYLVIGIILALNIANLVRNASWSVGAIYEVLNAFRKNILAQRWKALSSSLLLISASVLVMSFAVEKLSQIKAKDAMKAMIPIVALMGLYIGILALLSKMSGSRGIVSSIRALGLMLALSAGLSIFISAFSKTLKLVKDISMSDIGKTSAVIGLIGALLIGTVAVTFRKIERQGLFKGTLIKGPGMIQLLTLLGFVWLLIKETMWLIDKTKDISWKEIEKTGAIVGGIAATFLVVATTLKLLSNKLSITGGVQTRLSVEFGSMFVVILAAYYVIAKSSELNLTQIRNGALVAGAIFAGISAIVVSMGIANRIATRGAVQANSIRLLSSVASISFAILVTTLTFKMISGLSFDEVWAAGSYILALYTLLGGISIALSAVSKTVSMAVGKGGVNLVGARSPIGSAIFAITTSVLMCVIAMKYINSIKEEEFKQGYTRLAIMFGILTACIVLLSAASHFAKGKTVVALIATLVSTIILAVALIATIETALPDTHQDVMSKAMAMLIAFSAFIVAFTLIVGLVTKSTGFGIKQAASLSIMIGLIIAVMYSIMGIAMIISNAGTSWGNIWAAFGLFSAISAVIGGIIMGMAGIMDFMKSKDVNKTWVKNLTKLMIPVISSILVVAGAIIGLSKIGNAGKMWASFGLVTAIAALIGGMVMAVAGIAYFIKDKKINEKTANSMMKLIIPLTASIVVIAGAIAGLAVIPVSTGEMFAMYGLVAAIGGLIVALVLALVGVTMLAEKYSSMDSVKQIMKLVITMVAAIVVIAGVIVALSYIEKDLTQGVLLAAGIAASILLFVLAMVGISKMIKPENQNGVILTMVMIGVIVLAILGIAGAIMMLSSIQDGLNQGLVAAGLIAAGLIVAVLAIVGISKLLAGGAMVKVILALTTLAVIVASIIAIAYAFDMLAKIDFDKLLPVLASLGVVLVAMTAIVFVLGAFAGVAGLGALVLVGIAAGLLLIANAIKILAESSEIFTRSLISLMNEITKEKIKNILEFSGALVALSGATMINSLAGLGSALLDLGSSLVSFGESIVNLLKQPINGLTEFLGLLPNLFKKLNEDMGTSSLEKKANAYSKLQTALTKLSEIDESAITTIINAITSMTIDQDDGLISAFVFDSLTKSLASLAKEFDNNRSVYNAISGFVMKIASSLREIGASTDSGVLANLMMYLDSMQEKFDSLKQPVITPIIDLTNFRNGMAEIESSFGQSRVISDNFGAIQSNRANSYRPSGIGTDYGITSNQPAPVININNSNMFTDALTYGYDAMRTTANAVLKGVDWLNNNLEKVFG